MGHQQYERYDDGSEQAELLRFERLARELMLVQERNRRARDAATVDRAFHAKTVLAVQDARLRVRRAVPGPADRAAECEDARQEHSRMRTEMLQDRWRYESRYTEDLIAYLLRPALVGHAVQNVSEAANGLPEDLPFAELARQLIERVMAVTLDDPLWGLRTVVWVALPNRPREQLFLKVQHEQWIAYWTDHPRGSPAGSGCSCVPSTPGTTSRRSSTPSPRVLGRGRGRPGRRPRSRPGRRPRGGDPHAAARSVRQPGGHDPEALTGESMPAVGASAADVTATARYVAPA